MKKVPYIYIPEPFEQPLLETDKPVPQQFPLVYKTIKETQIEEGNFYMDETRWLQTKSVVMEIFTEDGKKQYKSFTDEEKNTFVKDVIEHIKGEPIDQIILMMERVTREGTPYQINQSVKTI